MDNSLKRIAIIGIVGLPANYGGFETLAANLVSKLNEKFDFTVYCSGVKYRNKIKSYNKARLVYIPLDANGVQSIIYDIWSIIHALFRQDALLVLGVSGAILFPFIKFFSRKKIIVNLDGIEWRRAKWQSYAKSFLKFSERCAVKYADEIIADNKVIQSYIKRTYHRNSHLIEYGACHVNGKDREKKSYVLPTEFNFEQYAFSVCRIVPENNIHIILEAFERETKFNLVIVGDWRNSHYGKQLKEKYQKFGHIHLLDPIYDQDILNSLRRNCTIYLHGHSAGGTNPSLIEAMYLQLPIIAFNVSFNRNTMEDKGMFFKSKEDLISNFSNLDHAQLTLIRNDLKEVADRRYTWNIISDKYSSLLNAS